MKCAVISLREGIGKTSLISTLGGVYSRSQAKCCCVLSTGSAQDNVDCVAVKVKPGDVANLYVFKSMLDAAAEGDKELLNYGTKQGDEMVFIYDLLSTSMSQNDKEEIFYEAMEKLPGDLILIEICGDYNKGFNKSVIEKCDCALVLFDHSRKSYKLMEEFKKEAPQKLQNSCCFVCSRYDAIVTSEKAIAAELGIKQSQLFTFPECPVIGKLSVNEQLDRVAYNVCVADNEVVMLRQNFLHIMQFIFDSAERKIIRSLDKWYYK